MEKDKIYKTKKIQILLYSDGNHTRCLNIEPNTNLLFLGIKSYDLMDDKIKNLYRGYENYEKVIFVSFRYKEKIVFRHLEPLLPAGKDYFDWYF